MAKLIFLKGSINNGKVVFDIKEQYEAQKTKSEYLLKGMAEFTDEKGIYHLKNKEYFVVWSNCHDGHYTSYIWCQKGNLKSAKEKCINELKKQRGKMKKYILQKEQNYLNYKKSVEKFCLNYL